MNCQTECNTYIKKVEQLNRLFMTLKLLWAQAFISAGPFLMVYEIHPLYGWYQRG